MITVGIPSYIAASHDIYENATAGLGYDKLLILHSNSIYTSGLFVTQAKVGIKGQGAIIDLAGGTIAINGTAEIDLGARFFDDLPENIDSLQMVVDTTQLIVTLKWSNPVQTIHGNPLDTLKIIHIWRNNDLLIILNGVNGSSRMTYTDQLPQPDYYRYQICADDTAQLLGRLR